MDECKPLPTASATRSRHRVTAYVRFSWFTQARPQWLLYIHFDAVLLPHIIPFGFVHRLKHKELRRVVN